MHKAMQDQSDFRTALLADPEISKILSLSDVDNLLKLEGYLGLANDEVEAVISHAKALRATDPEQ